MAYLIGADLTNAMGYQTKLSNADLSQANLRFTFIPSVNFTGANLSHANLSGAYLGALLDEHGIIEIPSDLTSADMTQADLRNASFLGAILAGADFTGAVVRGAAFDVFILNGTRTGGIALSQLYSTASYRAFDLSGIQLSSNDLHGGNFAGQNLTNAVFDGATLTGADFTGADARRAAGLDASAAATHNFISTDGHIRGLDLNAGERLVVRDYDGDPARGTGPIRITIDQHFAIAPGGTLRMVFEADAWDSTISFTTGIPVALGGTLELTFAIDVNLASQIGRTFDLFDWTGVNPTGAFAVTSPYTWDLSNLYTTGEVTLTNVPGLLVLGDFNRDGQLSAEDVSAMLSALADLNAYQSVKGLSDAALVLLGDLNGDHAVTNADLQSLLDLIASGQGSVPAVPEPSALVLAVVGLIGLVGRQLRRPWPWPSPLVRSAKQDAN